MQQQHGSTSRYILTTLAIILVICAFILVGLKAFMPKGVSLSPAQAYADGYAAAQEKFARLCPQTAIPVSGFSGIIVSVSGNRMVVRQDSLLLEAGNDTSDERTVTLAEDGKTVTTTPKDPILLAKELASFRTALEKSPTSSPPMPPMTVLETTIALSEFKAGQRVNVSSDGDIRYEGSIVATRIELVK